MSRIHMYRWQIGCLALLTMVAGSLTLTTPCHANAYSDGLAAYWRGDFEQATELLRATEGNQDKDYVLYLMNSAMASISAGDFAHAEGISHACKLTIEKELSEGEVAGQVLVADERKTYVGHNYEKVLVSFLLGLSQYMQGDYESARIGFLEALETDTGSKEEYEGDVAYVHYMLGKTFMRLGDWDDAAVAMRNADRYSDDMPYSILGQQEVAKADGRRSDAEDLGAQFLSSEKCASKIEADESNYVTVVLFNGLAPGREPDAITEAFATPKERPYPQRQAHFYVDGELVGCSYVLTDMMQQAKTAGGMGEQIASKVAGKVARDAAVAVADAIVPGLGCLTRAAVGDDDADLRFWATAPGDVQVCEVPVGPGLHTLKIEFTDSKGTTLERYEQVWYYVAASSLTPRTIVVRSLNDIHNQYCPES
jgi:tetratricopeptide (TPR) repeat protein